MQVHSGSYTVCVTDVDVPQQLRELRSSLENATRSVIVTHNELILVNKLPPEILIIISEFVAEPRSRESMFEIVKLTHVCEYWRSTLISCPHLWSSIFVKNDHRDFVVACLERSREAPLTVHLDLVYGEYNDSSDCTCFRTGWTPGMRINRGDLCRDHVHTIVDPLIEVDRIQRIHKLDVNFTIFDDVDDVNAQGGSDQYFKEALEDFGIFMLPLPILESLSFRIHHDLDDSYMEFPIQLFCWRSSPPTELRHLALRSCYGGPIQAVCNLTSLELSGDVTSLDPIELDQHTFLPLISNSPSLVSLHLSYCRFPDREQLLQVTPVKLSELKFLRLMDIHGLSGFPGLVEVPAFKTLSALWISAKRQAILPVFLREILVRAESDDGFQLLYNTQYDDKIASYWLGVMYDADPSPAFVRFEGELRPTRKGEMEASPLPLFINAKILEISASFASTWYYNFWKDLEKVGPQLSILRLEVTEGTSSAVVESVKEFVKARFQKGMPLTKLERMVSEGMSGGDEGNAKKLWEEFLAGLDIDQYLIAR